MRKQASFLTVAVVVATAVGTAWGENIWDPPWLEDPTDPQWAGGVTTHQRWEFDEDPYFPVESVNAFGQPFVEVGGTYPDVVIGPDGETEIPTWHIDNDGDGLSIYIPNNPLPNPRKVIFIQLTSDKGPLFGSPTSSPDGAVSYPKGPIKHGPTSWYTYTAQIDIPFNPPEEYVSYTFPASTNISEIVVDTICVPEPATCALLLCGGCFLLFRRRGRLTELSFNAP